MATGHPPAARSDVLRRIVAAADLAADCKAAADATECIADDLEAWERYDAAVEELIGAIRSPDGREAMRFAVQLADAWERQA